MRLLVDSELKPAGGIVAAGFDELRWPRPVRPGDVLRVESEVLEVRPSKSRPEQGLIKVRTTTLKSEWGSRTSPYWQSHCALARGRTRLRGAVRPGMSIGEQKRAMRLRQ